MMTTIVIVLVLASAAWLLAPLWRPARATASAPRATPATSPAACGCTSDRDCDCEARIRAIRERLRVEAMGDDVGA